MEEATEGKRAKRINSSKTPSTREFSAGGVVFKKIQNPNHKFQTLWLVAKSNPSKLYPNSYWRLPKGWLDDEDNGKKLGPLGKGEKKASEENLQKSALREVREEGGVDAKIVKKLGTERIFFTSKRDGARILKFITFYLMEWVRDLPEGPGMETSKVAWLPFEEAKGRLKYSGEKKVLDKAKKVLNSGVQESLV